MSMYLYVAKCIHVAYLPNVNKYNYTHIYKTLRDFLQLEVFQKTLRQH